MIRYSLAIDIPDDMLAGRIKKRTPGCRKKLLKTPTNLYLRSQEPYQPMSIVTGMSLYMQCHMRAICIMGS